MAHHVAFLRAINVGGRRVTNDALAAAVEGAGFTDVSTFLASGNVVYDAGDADPAASGAAVEVALAEALGFTTEAFVRVAAELDAILAADPFPTDLVAAATAKPQVVFLQAPLPADVRDAVAALSTEADHLQAIGREVHWLPMAGVGRAALDFGALDRLIGLSTVRSLNTVARIRPKLG